MKQYLLFDLDGTLTDPKIGITTCVQYALDSFGIKEPDLDRLECFIGPPLKDSFMEFYGMDDATAQAAVDKYRERFKDTGLFENKIYRGIPKMLKALSRRGVHMAVASSKPTVFVERILKHFHIDRYFEVVVGSELDGTRVEKDQVVEEALRRLFCGRRIEKDNVYMIGDRRFDVEGARAQGIESVGVSYGYGGIDELKEAKADYIVRTVEELEEFLLRGADETTDLSWNQRFANSLFSGAWLLAVFFLVRELTACILQLAGEAFLLSGDKNVSAGFTADQRALMSALGFLAAAGVILKPALRILKNTAFDMRLTHLKRQRADSYVLLGILSVCAVLGLNILLELTRVTESSAGFQAAAESQFAVSVPVGLFCYGLVSPLAEELMFRGIIYGGLRRNVGSGASLLVSSLLFGIYHLNVVQGIYGTVMGALMAYAYEYFGSFAVPVLIHAAANILAFCINIWGDVFARAAVWPVCIICLAVSLLCLILLRRRQKRFRGLKK